MTDRLDAMQIANGLARRMHDTAMSKRVIPSEFEAARRAGRGARKGTAEDRLTEGRKALTLDASGYQKHVWDPGRVTDVALLRRFYYPGYATKILEKNCLTTYELGVALGVGGNRLINLVRDREFPVALGVCLMGARKESGTPAYTVREGLTYMILLNQELGTPGVANGWRRNRERIGPLLFAARKQMHSMIYEKGSQKWMLKDEVLNDDSE